MGTTQRDETIDTPAETSPTMTQEVTRWLIYKKFGRCGTVKLLDAEGLEKGNAKELCHIGYMET